MKRLIATIILILATSLSWGAECSVSEFSVLQVENSGRSIQVAVLTVPSPITQLVTTVTAPEAVSNAFASGTRLLWIYCDELMHIQIGVTPTTGLTTADMRIPAGGFWIGVPLTAVRLGTLKIALCDADCT